MYKVRSIYANVFTFLDFMWSLGALPDGKSDVFLFLKFNSSLNISLYLLLSSS